jgi:flagellum-specific peptidoglycan hydrolase FlgJ
MPNPKQLEALAGFAASAVRAERLYGVPAEISVAQACVESAWGARVPGNNCLGIKANSRVPGSVEVATHECENGERKAVTCAFAAYPSLDACFEDHAILLSHPPYQAMLDRYHQSENLAAYIAEVARKYATDPNYAKLLLSLISMRAVQDALFAARKAAMT